MQTNLMKVCPNHPRVCDRDLDLDDGGGKNRKNKRTVTCDSRCSTIPSCFQVSATNHPCKVQQSKQVQCSSHPPVRGATEQVNAVW